ncbi:hypothetical protein D6T64_13785 [Cryobacterium melibiosiphilum]|uniref:Helix-hairpin-helix domain-containing protein n=1 Tax=Cryobacterium melibiosiphilum TaxID=995039 RepID=A0A3A5MEX2_9MICO|nr:helix-hairpin-helix domain-containing protein [Cryobacterium melibiosiphilum]RJT87665.1 hypothetical protein D6T64_13785 [Cryobacterium melibiosiphilum]
MTNTPTPTRGVSASATGPSLRWRCGASAWLLLLLFGGGALAWLAFGILAAVARRRSWGIIAGVYAVAAIGVQVPEDPAGHIAQGSLYLVALVHGLIINQGWLLLLWGRRENGLTVLGNARGAGQPRPTRRAAVIPTEAEQLLGGRGTSRSDYVDDSAPAPQRRPPRARRRTQKDEPAAPAAPAALIDVNTANQRTLARLTGMDRGLAKDAIAERTKRGGFASLEAFAALSGLQPHEMVRLGSEAFCSPRPRGKRSFGRRVDF